jgi:hypothetical protein
MTLPARLRDLADLLEADRLPAAAVEVLTAAAESPAVRRALRNDRIIRLASALGGAGAVYEAIANEAWRWTLWQQRGVPQRATTAERLAYEAWVAGPAVSRRQVERILRHRPPAQCRATPARLLGIATRSSP